MNHRARSILAGTIALAMTSSYAAAVSDEARLKRLEEAVDQLQKENASLKDQIHSEVASEVAATPAAKVSISSPVTELKLYGDLRLRYQYDNKDPQLDPPGVGVDNSRDERGPNGSQRSRWRFRLRLNADFKLGPNVFGGVELQTGQAADSANQTFENGFDDYSIFISKAFVGWKMTDYLTVTGGKMSNPFYTTDAVWDPDINPTGVTEVFAFHKLFAPEDTATEGLSKDGKSFKSVKPGELPWELTLVAGQFIFDDNLEGGGSDVTGATRDNDSTTDAYLFETQLVGSYKFGKDVKVTLAPAWMTYIGGSISGLLNENSFNDSALVSGATRDLNLLLAPGDISFKIANIKTKFYWDFAYNIEGRKRAEDIYGLKSLHVRGPNERPDPDDFNKDHSNIDDIAYLLGVQFGENKKKGDLSFLANWRQTGIASIDPNLNDSDFAQGELNTKGLKFGLGYNLADYAVFNVTYMYAWNLRKDLVGGEATGDNAIADSSAIQVLQVDLNVKF